MDLLFPVLGISLCVAASGWVLMMLLSDRMVSAWVKARPDLDPINGRRDRIAIHDQGPFIPMPDNLSTREEMVSWLMNELPKQTTGGLRSGTYE